MSHRRLRQHPLSHLEFTSRIRKRAQYEAFEFSLVPEGLLVRNESYADPENHEYRVTVEDGVPVACTCPADARFEGACKHRVAVAIRRPLLEIVSRARAVADGGYSWLPTGTLQRDSRVDPDDNSSPTAPTDPSTCETCESLDSLPCGECFRPRSRAEAYPDDQHSP
ncbi:SWIM zinc finger family protein [Salinigranum salinum]|uniref:SWIM zinc finger family protein n=1 Tax=Salinigranum salinum TaxID=1364937 RepID=UPI001260F3E3|nr:SWIM zinc finger family protein [Salinigranum salinum]